MAAVLRDEKQPFPKDDWRSNPTFDLKRLSNLNLKLMT